MNFLTCPSDWCSKAARKIIAVSRSISTGGINPKTKPQNPLVSVAYILWHNVICEQDTKLLQSQACTKKFVLVDPEYGCAETVHGHCLLQRADSTLHGSRDSKQHKVVCCLKQVVQPPFDFFIQDILNLHHFLLVWLLVCKKKAH